MNKKSWENCSVEEKIDRLSDALNFLFLQHANLTSHFARLSGEGEDFEAEREWFERKFSEILEK